MYHVKQYLRSYSKTTPVKPPTVNKNTNPMAQDLLNPQTHQALIGVEPIPNNFANYRKFLLCFNARGGFIM